MAEVNVVNEFGTVGTVPEEQLEKATAQGYTIATDEQVRAADLQEQYGDAPGVVAAGVAGGLRGASLGLSDAALGELGYGDKLRDLQEANPMASMGGEVVGGLAGVGKFRGAGMLARGMRAVSAPARAVTQVGARIAGPGGSLLRMGAGAAAEGAMFGAGNALSESYLQNKELTAEALLTGMGHGGLMGGALGVGVGGAARVLAGGARRTSNLLSRAVTKGGDASAPGTLTHAWAALSGRSADDLARYGSKGFRDRAVNSAKYVDEGIAKSVGTTADSDALGRLMRTEFAGANKGDAMAKLVTPGNEALTLPAARQVMDEMREAVTMMRKSPTHASQGLKKLEGQLGALDDRLTKVMAKGGEKASARAFMAVDSAKRQLGKVIYSAKYRAGKAGPLEQNTFKVLDDLYHGKARSLLENENLWGKAAQTQKALNKGFTETIESADVLGYDRLFSMKTGKVKGETIYGFSKDKAAKALKELSADGNAEKLEQFVTHLKRQESAAQGILDAPGVSPSLTEAAKKTIGGVKATMTHLDDVAKALDAGATHARLKGSSAQGNLVSTGFGYMLGAGLDPVTAAAAGGAINALRNPAGTIERFVALEQIAGTVTKRLSKRTAALTKVPKGALAKRPLAERTGRVLARAAGPAAGAVDRAKDKQRRYQRSASNIREILADAGGSREQMKASLAALGGVAPELVDMAVNKEFAKVEYLQQHLPTSELPRGPFELPPVPSKVEQAGFLRRLDVVENPLIVLDKLETGTLTSEHVEALQATAPAMYQQIQSDVFAGLSEASAAGQQVPFNRRLQLGILLDMPTDPMMAPEIISEMQAIYHDEQTPEAADGAQAPNQGPAPQVAGAYRTDSERLARGEA